MSRAKFKPEELLTLKMELELRNLTEENALETAKLLNRVSADFKELALLMGVSEQDFQTERRWRRLSKKGVPRK